MPTYLNCLRDIKKREKFPKRHRLGFRNRLGLEPRLSHHPESIMTLIPRQGQERSTLSKTMDLAPLSCQVPVESGWLGKGWETCTSLEITFSTQLPCIPNWALGTGATIKKQKTCLACGSAGGWKTQEVS